MVTDLTDGSRLMVIAATVVEFVFFFFFFFVLDCDLLRTIFSICVHKNCASIYDIRVICFTPDRVLMYRPALIC